MKKNKIYLILLVTAFFIASLYACGNDKKDDKTDYEKSTKTEDQEKNKEDKKEDEVSKKEEENKEDKEEKNSEKNSDNSKDKEDEKVKSQKSGKEVLENLDFAAPGYKVGEIPPIPLPIIPDVLITEKPDAKITVSKAKNISSVEGITITPVKIEDGEIVGGGLSAQILSTGISQVVEDNTVVQRGADGNGQYIDENIVIQNDGDGGGNYINNLTGISIQAVGDGGGNYYDSKNDINLSITKDGTGQYSDNKKKISLSVTGDGRAQYLSENVVISNDGDGSGSYTNFKLDLTIVNDGKGTVTISKGSETVTVDAEPLKPFEGLPKISPIPPIPAIEANGILINLDSGVLFDVDMYNIRPDAHEILKKLSQVLKEAEISEFQINGHTDSDASDEHNQVLSENRANSVKDFLLNEGVESIITTKGFGEKQPVATNETPEGKQLNRRVEIIIPAN